MPLDACTENLLQILSEFSLDVGSPKIPSERYPKVPACHYPFAKFL